ncbi:hypothetical protein SK128_014278 [Halocaridina rubra]|uniref:Tudor domain-containing protein 1 n=1 Tax=Halocaridina rubra TaxID=373956 RepID=A0AAN8WUJ3_HALRR
MPILDSAGHAVRYRSNMGTNLKPVNTINLTEDAFDDWIHHNDDVSHQSFTDIRSKSLRSVNMARSKEVVREPHGVYIRNIPNDMKEEELHRLCSEYGKVLSVFIRNARKELKCSKYTWGIVRVQSMKDAISIIRCLNARPPFNFKVQMAHTEEEKTKRNEDRNFERELQRKLEDASNQRESSELITYTRDKLPGIFSHAATRGRAVLMACNNIEVPRITSNSSKPSGDDVDRNVPPFVETGITSTDPAPKNLAIEFSVGNILAKHRQQKPCIVSGCKNMGVLICSVCGAFYCSKLCQVNDWYEHSAKCRPPPPLFTLGDSACRSTDVMATGSSQSDLLALKISEADVKRNFPMEGYNMNNIVNNPVKVDMTSISPDKLNKKIQRSFNANSNVNANRHSAESPVMGHCSYDGIVDIPKKVDINRILQDNLPKKIHENLNVDRNICTNRHSPENRNADPVACKRINPLISKKKSLRKPVMITDIAASKEDERLEKVSHLRKSPLPAMKKDSNQYNGDCKDDSSSLGFASYAMLLDTNIFEESVTSAKQSAVLAVDSVVNPTSLQSSLDSPKIYVSEPIVQTIPNHISLVEKLNVDKLYIGSITQRKDYKYFTLLIFEESFKFLIRESNSVFSSIAYNPDFRPKVGDFVVAKSSLYLSWYRSYVFDIENDTYSVIYIDFGSIWKTKEVKALPEGPFSYTPGLAMVAELHHSVSDAVHSKLKDMIVLDGLILFKVLEKKNDALKVVFIDKTSEAPIAQYILKPWYANLPNKSRIAKPEDDSLFQSIQVFSPDAHVSINGKPKSDDVSSSGGDALKSSDVEILKNPSLDQTANLEVCGKETIPCKEAYMSVEQKTYQHGNKFWSRDLVTLELKPNKFYDILPVQVTDDNHLYVHLLSKSRLSEKIELCSRIAEHCENATMPSSLEVGEVVCGFVPLEEAWRRVEVKIVRDSDVTGSLIDYGIAVTLLKKYLRSISPELFKLPVMAVMINLNDVQNDDAKANTFLASLVAKKEPLRLKDTDGHCSTFNLYSNDKLLNNIIAYEPSERLPLEVECSNAAGGNKDSTKNSESVIKDVVLLQKNIPEYMETMERDCLRYADCEMSPLPPTGDIDIVVIHADGPHSIFAVALDSLELYAELDNICFEMQDYCESHPIYHHQPFLGELCFAKWKEDGAWYRAACIEVGVDVFVVFLVDFGNTIVIEKSDIRKMRPDFLKIPCIVRHCILKGISEEGVQTAASPRLKELMPPNTIMRASITEYPEEEVYVIDLPAISHALINEGLVRAK